MTCLATTACLVVVCPSIFLPLCVLIFTAVESMLFSNQVVIYVVFFCVFGGTWVCWLAIKDSLTNLPSSQGWAPECPLGSILYFVLVSCMVSGLLSICTMYLLS